VAVGDAENIGVLRVTLVALGSTVSTIFAVYALSFAVDGNGLDKTTMLWVAIVTNVVALAAIPAWAILADRIGRSRSRSTCSPAA
jgi:MFS family permease